MSFRLNSNNISAKGLSIQRNSCPFVFSEMYLGEEVAVTKFLPLEIYETYNDGSRYGDRQTRGVRQPTNEKTRKKIKGNAKQTVRQKANLKSIKWVAGIPWDFVNYLVALALQPWGSWTLSRKVGHKVI